MSKGSEIDELLASLNGLRISHLLACHWAELSIRSEAAANQTVDPDRFEQGCQNNRERRDRDFFIQNHTWPNKKHVFGKQQVCNDADPEEGLASWLECCECLHWSEYWGTNELQLSVKKSDWPFQSLSPRAYKVTQVVAVNAVPPKWKWCPLNFGEARWDVRYPAD